MRVFACCHTSQSIGSTNQKKSFCYWPFGNHCILSKLSFTIFTGYMYLILWYVHGIYCCWCRCFELINLNKLPLVYHTFVGKNSSNYTQRVPFLHHVHTLCLVFLVFCMNLITRQIISGSLLSWSC